MFLFHTEQAESNDRGVHAPPPPGFEFVTTLQPVIEVAAIDPSEDSSLDVGSLSLRNISADHSTSSLTPEAGTPTVERSPTTPPRSRAASVGTPSGKQGADWYQIRLCYRSTDCEAPQGMDQTPDVAQLSVRALHENGSPVVEKSSLIVTMDLWFMAGMCTAALQRLFVAVGCHFHSIQAAGTVTSSHFAVHPVLSNSIVLGEQSLPPLPRMNFQTKLKSFLGLKQQQYDETAQVRYVFVVFALRAPAADVH